MSFPESLLNCLICGKELDEEKPLISSENVEIFKRSFHCFCRLLNLSSEDDVVDEIVDGVISAQGDGLRSSSELAFGLPCCCDCFRALSELDRLQESIEELKTAQMAHVEELKHSFKSTSETLLDHDGPGLQSWSQLVTCIQKHLSSDSVETTDHIEGVPYSMELDVSPPSLKDPLGEDDEQKCVNTFDEMPVPPSPLASCPSSPSSFESSSSSNLLEEEQISDENAETKGRKTSAKNSPRKKRTAKKRRLDKNDNGRTLTLRKSSRAATRNVYEMASDGDTDSANSEDFVPSAGSDDEDDDFTLEPEDTVPRRNIVPMRKPETTKSKPGIKRKRGGVRKLNNLFYRITDNILLYKFTLLQVSPCRTQHKCVEQDCSAMFHDLSSFHLFEKMSTHVDQLHLPNKDVSSSLKRCVLTDCKEEFQEASHFRSHLLDHHKCTTVICEICWKPFVDRGDSLMNHKWFHRSDKEKLEVPAPTMVIQQTKRAKNSKYKWVLEKAGDAAPPIKWKVTKSEFFSKLSETLLLYKFTVIRVIPGKGFSCEEPGCSTGLVAKGIDYEAFETVKAHVETSHLEGDGGKMGYSRKVRKCPVCLVGSGQDGDFNGQSIREHLFTEHGSPPPFLCHCCWKPLSCEKNLRRHLLTHQSVGERRASGDQEPPAQKMETRTFICDDCGKQFQRADCYNRHKRMHLPSDLRNKWICEQCPKTFTNAHNLKVHAEKFHVAPERNQLLTCTICNKQYLWRDKERFAVHVRSHSNERPFVCDICGASFVGRDNLRKHLNGVHMEGKRHQCEFCDMNYKHVKHLRRHQLKNHSDMVAKPEANQGHLRSIPPEFRPGFIGPKIAFPCEICEKVFPLKCRLTQHLKKYHPNT